VALASEKVIRSALADRLLDDFVGKALLVVTTGSKITTHSW